ncbi:toll/interleukin-1 receptor domain-containing protein, partial [Pseudanabaenaceae cyanobacterium LEGE 13415]|nr:toll/interleukin-1 receptor domain-containing protein [Pseudanabaenaceae cyanobacterium LEGE 13415]
ITIVRDKRDLGFKGRIKAFMEEISRGKAIIVIVSEKYLKSENCMFELVEIAKNGEFYDRIFPIVLEDANIYKPAQRLKYIRHWEEQIRELEEGMRTVGAANIPSFRKDIDLYTEIRSTIDKLIDTLRDMNSLTPGIHTESGFQELLNAITTTISSCKTTNDVQNRPIEISSTQCENEQSLGRLANEQTQKNLDRNINEFAAILQPTDPNLRTALTWLYDSEGSTRARTVRAEALERCPEVQAELLTDLSKLTRFENELTNCVYRLHWAIFTDDFRPISDVKISFTPEVYKVAIDIIESRLPIESEIVRERFQKHIQFLKRRLDATSRA